VKPLFSEAASAGRLAMFAYGQLLQGQPLAWVLCGPAPTPARLRGRLWRLPSGSVLLSLDPRAGWVHGELHPEPAATALAAIPGLLACEGLEPSFQQVRVRIETRAQLVQTWAVGESQLRRCGAHPLASGDWRRIAPR
jgi:gamma-glutamylcyclotransferase (GGCT)/AIG2-like uncharacterized protein YtfP